MKKLLAPAGSDELTAYRGHGSAVDLFRAYIARRKADTDAVRDRSIQLRRRAEAGLSPELFEALSAELLMLDILAELDPIVRDLVRTCERPPGKDDMLVNLRAALRIGKGRAPIDADAARKRWRAVPLWMQAYIEIERTGSGRSDRDIAREIGRALGMDWRTAMRHWERFAAERPWQAQWVQQMRARIRAGKPSKK